MACLNPFLLRLALQTKEGNYNEYLLHTSAFPVKSQGEEPEEIEEMELEEPEEREEMELEELEKLQTFQQPSPDWYVNRQNNAFEAILEYFDKRKDALENANWTCSPFSFMCCLAMVVAGETTTESEGTTTHACEDCKPFCFPYSPTTTLQQAVQLQALQQFAKQLTSVPVCRDANILLQTLKFSETAEKYREKLVEYFQALCYDTKDYQAVNKKVQEITTIPNVLNQQPEGTCVINCVYLKNTWRKTFDEETNPVRFKTSKQGVVVVDMMQTTQSVEFVKHTSMIAVCLPYTTNGLRAWFVKGNTAADADTAVRTFLAYRFGLQQLAHQTEKIVLQIPKIKLKNKIDLKAVLQDRSITSIFEGGNLLNMSGDSSEFINKFEQHCFLDVDQEGTTAGAVTTASALRGKSIASVTFACTFFMLIEYENTLLFASKIDNPSVGNRAQGSYALKDSDFDLSEIRKVTPSSYALKDLSSQTDLHSKSLELTVLAAAVMKKEYNLRIKVTEKVDKDAIEYDFEEKNASELRKVLLPQPGGKTYPIVVYHVKPEMLYYVSLQNLSDVDCKLQFVYVGEDNEEPEEIETAKKEGGILKTPYPIQKDAGEEPDGWLIKDMKGNTVLGITFEVQDETGK
jgi:serine protease inhibitor